MTRQTKAYLVLALTFVLGVGTGGAAAFGVVQKHHAAMLRDEGGNMMHRRMRVLSRRLDLDRDQEEKVRPIMRRESEEGFRLREEMFEKHGEAVRAHEKQIDDQIRAVLRPDQIPRYDELAKRGRFPGRRPQRP